MQPEDKSIILDGLRFHYLDWSGEGRPLVLLHGLASTSHIWDLVAPLLTDDFRVVALDQRGHGETDKPDTGYDFDTIVADLATFLGSLQVDRPLLAGHSWGGNVALQYAAANPEAVRGLVLVDGGFLEISAEPGLTWEEAQKRLAPPDLAGMPRRQLLENAAEWLAPVWRPEIEPILLANFEIDEQDRVHPRLSRANHMRVVRALWEHKPSRMYHQVRCPVLVVPARPPDTDDEAAQWLARKVRGVARAAAELPDVQVLWLDSIHDVPLHRPQELATAIRVFAADKQL